MRLAHGSTPKAKIFIFCSWEHSKEFPNEKDSIGRMEKRSPTKKKDAGALQSQEIFVLDSWERSKGFPNKK